MDEEGTSVDAILGNLEQEAVMLGNMRKER